MTRQQRWLTVLFFALGVQAPRAQAPAPVALADLHHLKCAFTLMATGTWDKGVPSADVTPAILSMEFDAIDTQEGTANVTDVSTSAAGAPHITVRLLGDSLHFLAMNISGSVYLTTVFADRESRAGAKFKAVHTRHEFTQIRLTGWTSRPEQYYGQCESITGVK
jgi:cytochrome c1